MRQTTVGVEVDLCGVDGLWIRWSDDSRTRVWVVNGAGLARIAVISSPTSGVLPSESWPLGGPLSLIRQPTEFCADGAKLRSRQNA